jgi:rod shape-determining protein MreB
MHRLEVVARVRCAARKCEWNKPLSVKSAFSDDISIDLGTANTLVHVAGRGIIIDEPSVVAVQSYRGVRELLAVGRKAKVLVSRAPASIEEVHPLRDGFIADFVATEEMLRHFIRRTKTMLGFRRPRILICVPAGATPVERRAVFDTAKSLGARKVYLVAEPVAASLGVGLSIEDGTALAASLGVGLSIEDGTALLVVDVGGGTTDIAVLSRGVVVAARTLRCAGNAMDEAVIRYVRRKHNLLIGQANAERIKIEAGTAVAMLNGRAAEVHIRGRDVRSGLAKMAVLTTKDIAAALSEPVDIIADFIERTLAALPPDVLSEISLRGIYLTGGGALLNKLDAALSRQVGIRVRATQSPMHCVVKGSAMVLAELVQRAHLLMRP